MGAPPEHTCEANHEPTMSLTRQQAHHEDAWTTHACSLWWHRDYLEYIHGHAVAHNMLFHSWPRSQSTNKPAQSSYPNLCIPLKIVPHSFTSPPPSRQNSKASSCRTDSVARPSPMIRIIDDMAELSGRVSKRCRFPGIVVLWNSPT